MNNKLGLIKVAHSYVDSNKGLLCQAFGSLGITPIQVYEDMNYCQTIYKCIGECFDDVKECERIKEYAIESKPTDDGLTHELVAK